MSRSEPPLRDAFAFFHAITTRWSDNDAFGHVNNVTYYSYIDTAVNVYLLARGVLDIAASGVVGVVVENGCRFHSAIAYPDRVTVGLRVAKLGGSSVTYALGVFRNDEARAAAEAHFTHVYVDRTTMRPVPMPDDVRRALRDVAKP